MTELFYTPYKMPPSMRCGVCVYLVSDETGSEVRFEFTGAPEFNPAGFDELIKVACDSLNTMTESTDARPMTADEVASYIEKQKQDNDGVEFEDDE